MIGLTITGKEKMLLTELPQDIYQLHHELYTELGIHQSPGNIKLTDSKKDDTVIGSILGRYI